MKTKLIVSAIVLFAVCPVRAETLWSYDFDNLNPATIAGQDGWVNTGFTGWRDCEVASVAGGDGYSALVPAPTDKRQAHGNYRPLDASITLTSADPGWTSITQSFDIYTGAYDQTDPGNLIPPMQAREASGGLTLSGGEGTRQRFVWGVLSASNNDQINVYFRNWAGTMYYGDLLENDTWYNMRYTMDLSTRTCTIEYKKAGETSYTTDPKFTNFATGIPTADSYTFIDLRIGGQGGTAFDNFVLSDPTVIPEPSTLALLVCGLIGLLAYAWRKRR